MRLFIIFIFLFLSANSARAQKVQEWNNNYSGLDSSSDIIAIIGEKISLTKLDYDDFCPEDRICMDSRFNARYKVIEILRGQFDKSFIDFAVYDHYGKPRFSKYDRVVLYCR